MYPTVEHWENRAVVKEGTPEVRPPEKPGVGVGGVGTVWVKSRVCSSKANDRNRTQRGQGAVFMGKGGARWWSGVSGFVPGQAGWQARSGPDGSPATKYIGHCAALNSSGSYCGEGCSGSCGVESSANTGGTPLVVGSTPQEEGSGKTGSGDPRGRVTGLPVGRSEPGRGRPESSRSS